MRWAFILALLFAHGFTEFFAYTRGYGMSMALLAGAVWHLMEAFRSNRVKNFVWTMVFITLAQSANLTLISSAIIMIILLYFKIIITANKEPAVYSSLKSLIILNLGIIPLVFFSYVSFIMKEKNLLYYGSATGFWDITVNTQLGFIFSLKTEYTAILATVLSVISLLLFFRLLWNKDQFKKLDNPHFIFFYLFSASLISVFLLNAIFHVNYPEDRTGMYLYFYLPGALVFLLDRIKFKGQFLYLIVLLPLLLIPVDFIFSMNLARASVWPIDKIPHRFYDKVKEHFQEGEYPPSVGGYKLRHFCWSYLGFKDGGNMSHIFSGSYPGLDTDFQISRAEEIPRWRIYYDSLDFDRSSGLYLLQRKVSLDKEFIFGSGTRTFEPDSVLWLSLFQKPCNTLIGKTLYIELDVQVHAESKPFRSWIVAEVLSPELKTLRYEFLSLEWLKTDWTEDNARLKNILMVHELPENAQQLRVYIWNLDQVTYQVKSSEVDVYSLVKDYSL
jgi:hypothetical protein